MKNELNKFIAETQARINNNYATNYPNLEVPVLDLSFGAKFVKVWFNRHGQRESIFAFINAETGDVLKPASTKAPAKGARGNLLDASGGLSAVSSCGNYIRYNKSGRQAETI